MFYKKNQQEPTEKTHTENPFKIFLSSRNQSYFPILLMISHSPTYMRLLLVCIISFCFSIAAWSQEPPPSSLARPLIWQAEKPLQWEHFQGKADKQDVVHGAVTYAGIDLKVVRIEAGSGIITFKAMAIFDQAQSWVNSTRRDPALLAHEQLHFDIAEVYARKLEKKLNSMRLTQRDTKTVKRLRQIFYQAQLDCQESYDEETLHGIREKKQQEWRRNIDQHLQFSEPSSLSARKKPDQEI